MTAETRMSLLLTYLLGTYRHTNHVCQPAIFSRKLDENLISANKVTRKLCYSKDDRAMRAI